MRTKYSILIPCFNEKNTIKVLIEKVIEVNLENFEIIVVDDNSFDGTTDMLKDLENRYNFLMNF